VLTVSVVIPAVNEAARIERAIASAIAAGAEETIVVDGGSRDTTRSLASRAGAKVIEATAGRAHQQNQGAAVACGQILLFLHADNWLGSEASIRFAERCPQTPISHHSGARCDNVSTHAVIVIAVWKPVTLGESDGGDCHLGIKRFLFVRRCSRPREGSPHIS